MTVTLRGDAGPVRVVDGASLSLCAGEVVDIAGPSGAGKSTLLRALARLLPVASGSLALNGRPSGDVPPFEWRARVALLPQKPALVAGDVARNLVLPWSLKVHGEKSPVPTAGALTDALESVGLFGVSPERDVSRLSMGQQARVALLRVLLTRPEVLLLDEPDAALDNVSAEHVAAVLREFAASGGGVIRARHRSSDGLALRRLVIEHGRLRSGGPS